jgi:CRISPR/Cas system CSM-associated protein Csm2 small subunit
MEKIIPALLLLLIAALIKHFVGKIRSKNRNSHGKINKNTSANFLNTGRNFSRNSNKNIPEGGKPSRFQIRRTQVKSKPGYNNIRGYSFEIPKDLDRLRTLEKEERRIKVITLEKGTMPPLAYYQGPSGQITFIPGYMAVYNELIDEFTVWSKDEYKKRFIEI